MRSTRAQLLISWTFLLIIGASLAGCGDGTEPTVLPSSMPSVPQASPIPLAQVPGRIALSAYLEDTPSMGFDIYLVNSDASGLINLTNNPSRDMYPSWSPDGRRIAFCSDREGSSQIYSMNPDGSDQVRLSDGINDCGIPSWSTPTWSPDGQWIAITSAPEAPYPEGALDVFVINALDSQSVDLTNHPANEGGISWSPDSKRLAFGSDRDGNEEVYVADIDGTGLLRLTENPARDGGPVWSPDGTRLLFVSNRDGNFEVYVMNADGSGQTVLTRDAGSDLNPAWSPDGEYIAFTSDRDGNTEIYRMNPDGSGPLNLTHSPENDYWFSWSPTGEQIAFSSCAANCQSADARWNTSVMQKDGSHRLEILPAGASISWEP